MASLAPHVSRVSKAYTPHGFSIYTDVVINIGTLSATGSDLFLMGSEDSDIYVEAITILSEGSVASHPTNIWTFQAGYKSAAGGAGSDFFATPPTTTANPIINHVPMTLTPDQNQLVPDGRGVYITCTKGGTAANLTNLKVQIRYRRKA
jgi:hypothetical protein